jgi:hypothetical protein
MALYKDSLGNTYTRLPKAPPVHKAKPTHVHSELRASRSDKPDSKYNRYRRRRGRPNGPGQPGNKSGKNKIR